MIPQYIYDNLVFLRQHSHVNIYLLRNSTSRATPTSVLNRLLRLPFRRPLHRALFKTVCWVEHRLLSISQPTFRCSSPLRDTTDLGDEIIEICPIFSKNKLTVRYSNRDIEKIRALDLEFIIRGNASGIFKGKILRSANHGIISFHHGDNRWNRGGPPGFWEVYLRKPATGFIVQRLTEELDNGEVLLRGEILTSSTYTENRQRLFRDSQPLLQRLLVYFLTNNEFPKPEQPIEVSPEILKIPSALTSLLYIYKTLLYFASGFLRRHILGRRQRWSVGFLNKDPSRMPPPTPTLIKNPSSRFFADPFLIKRFGRTVCYVEDYSFQSERGQISAIELFPDQTYKFLGPVITENFHLSFPFIFEFNNNLYMVPETSAARAVKLYRCVDFPMNWEFQFDLMTDISAVDSLVLKKEGLWWLLTTVESLSNDSWSNLHAYYSDSPVNTDWQPHPGNPIVSEVDKARNGGMLETNGGTPVRVRQRHGFRLYGKSITVAVLDGLTTSGFTESEISLKMDWLPDEYDGFHHLHSLSHCTAFDFLRFERPD